MATIPLYHSPPQANATHGVHSPGGYERWHFFAEDVYRDVRIVAALYDGYPFHPEYLRQYRKYRSHPTHIAPPIPRDYPLVQFAVFRGHEILGQFTMQYAPSACSTSVGAPRVSIGPNRLVEGRNLQLHLSGITSKKGGAWAEAHVGRILEGTFVFASREISAQNRLSPLQIGEENQRAYISSEISGSATHQWITADSFCGVTGAIQCAGEKIEFAGRGYHDQSFGTAPIGIGVRCWLSGQVLFDDGAYAFNLISPANRDQPDEIHLIRDSTSGVQEIPVAYAAIKWSGFNRWGLRYPKQIEFEDAMTLSAPRIIDTSPFNLRLAYTAKIRERTGKAFCEIVWPRRTTWPLLGTIIDRSIDRENINRR